MSVSWNEYDPGNFYDELIKSKGKPRKYAKNLAKYLADHSDEELETRKAVAELSIKEMGITFTVYTEEEGSIDRSWPFDILPRMIPKSEWANIEKGLKQRVHALNLFIDDIYHEQKIITDGVFPRELLANSVNFRKECVGVSPPLNIWAHICGSDLVRDADGTVYVLEDNLRVPSGVSYMLENRSVMKRVFPELFESYNIQPVDDYCSQLFDMLASLSPRPADYPEVVVLTPGIFNSAYFEHAYLAQQMGCELVEGRDLVVEKDDCVYMRTVEGLQRVDVIYRRIDDLFLDPEAFNPDSQLGVPGLMRAWKKGNVALANAPGAGVADDKVVYAFVPEIIKYYLGEEVKIPNVPTYRCMFPEEQNYVLEHLAELVVKPANESGGYGMMIGPMASKKEHEKFAKLIKKDPRNYIAQPTLGLSTVPTFIDHAVEPRHVDLRPFILSGDNISVTMGGLTRVALRKGSLVVNSSQGGGSKDTWIVEEES
ncbi:MAG: circularly permuted type 2 ATP-grasp protein [Pseudomonadota bacterium]|nr:circularly permuted type 2 ATP-grasp protein [Pseudomonadota bacterium]